MRASRLVSLLLLLQARGGMTAAELAEELEVSVRTIHRDVEALGASGVPIYADRGPHGGIRLVDGYRTRLTGMTTEEADALFLSGLPGPAAELGLGTVVAAARLKVLAALPTELRGRASRLLERFHLDAAGWFRAGESVPHLATIAQCVWDGQRMELDYERADGIVTRTVDPLGLVLKAGVWYLVAGHGGQIRTYRVSRARGVAPLAEKVERPTGFDLATHWSESITAYERDQPRIVVTLRVRREATRWLEDVIDGSALAAAIEEPDPEPDAWRRLTVTLDWPREVAGRLLALGGSIEVMAPPELRVEIAALAAETVARYREPATAGLPNPAGLPSPAGVAG
jgi:predicted DNA-binding transcriptional regulator YafY